jgi:hypothetical protein
MCVHVSVRTDMCVHRQVCVCVCAPRLTLVERVVEASVLSLQVLVAVPVGELIGRHVAQDLQKQRRA